MAVEGYVVGIPVVIKESGGKFFLSREVGWAKRLGGKIPESVRARNDAFKGAVAGCRTESKYKGGTVWGVSAFNKCIGERLKK